MAYIESVRIRAFKSFGSEVQQVEFKPGFNLICGANGSGKSNILDAISFAMGEKHGELRVGCLADLQNAGAKERCEVSVQIRRRQSAANFERRGKETWDETTHTVESKLLPDFTKQVRLDGKIRTQKELKEFLRDIGLRFDESLAVVRQSKVTELADANNPAKLASLVSFASGAGRWRCEVEKAQEMLATTQKSFEDISHNIALLEDSVQRDKEKQLAIQQIQELEVEAKQLTSALQAFHTRESSSVAAELGQVMEEKSRLESGLATVKDAAAACAKRVQSVNADLNEEQRELRMRKDELLQRQARAEEELHLLEEARRMRKLARERSELVAQQHEEAVRKHQFLDTRQAVQQRVVEQLQKTVSSLRLHNAICAGAGALGPITGSTNVGMQAKDEQDLAAVVKQLASEAVERESALRTTRSQGLEALAQLGVLRDELAAGGDQATLNLSQWTSGSEEALGNNYVGRLTCVRNEVEELASQVAEGEQRELGLAQRLQVLKAKLGMEMSMQGQGRMLESAGRAERQLPQPPWPLHSLFRFLCSTVEQEEQLRRHLVALDIIAGSQLRSVCVVPDIASAKALLKRWDDEQQHRHGSKNASRFSKIWPLDTIQTPQADVARRQRTAQEQLGGVLKVLVPLGDCMQSPPGFEGVLRRALGASLIAADDSVASTLISSFGLPSVTLAGNVRRKGSISGGWRGQREPVFLLTKLEHDTVERDLERASASLNAARKRLANCERALRLVTLLHTASTEKRLLDSDISALRKQLHTYQEAAAARAAAPTGGGGGLPPGGPSSAEKLLEDAQANLMALEADVLASAELLAKLEEERQQLEEQLAVEDAENPAMSGWAPSETVEMLRDKLGKLGRELGEVESLLAKGRKQGKLGSVLHMEQRMLEDHGREQKQLEGQLCQASARLVALQKTLTEGDQQRLSLEGLIQGEPCLSSQHEQLGKMDVEGATHLDSKSYEQKFAHLKCVLKRYQQLRKKHQFISEEERLRIVQRAEELAVFQERAASVQESVNILLRSIESNLEKVDNLNEQTFEDIRSSFRLFCSHLCPEKSVDLLRVGAKVDNGLAFAFAAPCKNKGSVNDTGDLEPSSLAAPDAGGKWHKDLKQLSGGQRTLLALSCLLAAAKFNKSSVYLLDEADAALDAQNQAKLANLIREEIASKGQVICVSHNAAFQAFATNVVNVSSSAGVTQVVKQQSSKRLK